MRDARRFLALVLVGLAGGAGCAGDGSGLSATDAEGGETLLTLNADGAGDLDGTTPFSAEAVRAALPEGFVLEPGQIEVDSATTLPVLYAFYDGQIVLEVYPDAGGQRVGRIDAASQAVTSPRGIRPGVGFDEADGGGMDCEPGRAEFSGRAVCSPRRGGDAVRYVFAHGGTAMPGALPDGDVLRQSILERIVWTAR